MVIHTGSKKTETIDATPALETIAEAEKPGKGMSKSPALVKSPRLMKSPLLPRATEEMEFVSVGRKPRLPSTRGSGHHRVIWTSAKS